jgi:hypothetical protein
VANITILSDFTRAFSPDAVHEKADYFRQRHRWWNALAAEAGWELTIADSGAVRSDPALLGKPSVCFLDTPFVPPADYRALGSACGQAIPAERVLQHPDEVDAVLSMAGAYRTLQGSRFAKIRTAYVPVSPHLADELTTAADVERLLKPQIDEALSEAGLDPGRGLFVRGFYASLRSQHPSAFFAATRPQLWATCARVCRGLRQRPGLGGFAIREYLELEQVPMQAGAFPLEVRLSFVDGRCISASYHGPYETLDGADRAILAAKLRDPEYARVLSAVADELERAGLPPHFVADVFFLRGSTQPLLSEFNPLYSSGYHVPLARAWVQTCLAVSLAEFAGYQRQSPEWSRRMAEQLAGETWTGPGAVLWLGAGGNHAP